MPQYHLRHLRSHERLIIQPPRWKFVTHSDRHRAGPPDDSFKRRLRRKTIQERARGDKKSIDFWSGCELLRLPRVRWCSVLWQEVQTRHALGHFDYLKSLRWMDRVSVTRARMSRTLKSRLVHAHGSNRVHYSRVQGENRQESSGRGALSVAKRRRILMTGWLASKWPSLY